MKAEIYENRGIENIFTAILRTKLFLILSKIQFPTNFFILFYNHTIHITI